MATKMQGERKRKENLEEQRKNGGGLYREWRKGDDVERGDWFGITATEFTAVKIGDMFFVR